MNRITTGRIIAAALALAALCAAFAAGYFLRQPPGAAMTPAEANPHPAAEGGRRVLYWYDPMSPAQRFDKPGKSPFMDMPLTPRYADEAQQDGGVTVSSRQQQNLGVRLGTVEQRVVQPRFAAFGTVSIDDRGIKAIPARANGLVEKLYVRAEQQQVKKNQPLARLWIPEWSAAQQEYLAVRHLGDASLTAAARQRLQLLFMPEEIVRAIEKTGQPQTRIEVRAPEQGFISRLEVREGSQVSTSQAMFELSSLDPVWVVADYPESQAGAVQPGSDILAATPRWPGESFHGRIAEILPVVDNATRTYRARIALENHDGRLQPGMYLNVRLAQAARGETVLAMPQDALIQTGSSNTVLLAKGDGHFTPVSVIAGREFGDWVEVRKGLSAGDRVVTSGQFLIDSEASLRSALPQMAGDGADASSPATAEANPPAAADAAMEGMAHSDPAAAANQPATAANPAMDGMDHSSPAGAANPPAAADGTAKNGTARSRPAATPEYATEGVIDAVNGEMATMSHHAVPGLNWPPMTMDFILPAGGLPKGITVGGRVLFHFRLDDSGARITQMMPLGSAK
ncbi:efflux RND transporter periplasmic adaptor subunit [Acerihabitans arboris]|uniref:Efflux RND transporter periplasmic adaptor subunit n=1 Tax=Acerihabitans arboris TaxID=2691583 RepID=A0A845SVZ9_9GAMM|nr:efflux RND transporter periplasmic adaptor subunit [Acerihabitans arboris]NDL65105.1 efflux RND transporter periplasmic adaptor subunit [Acerihabitans arboris]